MRRCTTWSVTSFRNGLLKKTANIVLASFRASTYPPGTPRPFTRCGLADGLFEQPSSVMANQDLATRLL